MTLSGNTSPSPVFTAPSVNENTTLIFQLEVTDSQGATSTPDTVNIDVGFVNHPPVAIARSDFPPHIVDNEVTLSGSESNDPDPGDSIAEYHWEQADNSGVKVTLSDPDSATTSFNAPSRVPTRYISEDSSPQIIPLQFSLVVTDTHGIDTQQISHVWCRLNAFNPTIVQLTMYALEAYHRRRNTSQETTIISSKDIEM